MEASFLSKVEETIQKFHESYNQANGRRQEEETDRRMMENRQGTRCYFQYDGAFHYVPQDFVVPKGSCKNFWFRWHLAQESHGIGPYKKLKTRAFMTLDLKRDDQLLVK